MQFSRLQRKSFAAHRRISFLFLKLERLYYFRLRVTNSLFLSWNGLRGRGIWFGYFKHSLGSSALSVLMFWWLAHCFIDIYIMKVVSLRQRYKNTLQLQIPLIVLKQGSELRQWKILLCPWETVRTEQKYVDVLILRVEWENHWWKRLIHFWYTMDGRNYEPMTWVHI